jgi:hypothetical protein
MANVIKKNFGNPDELREPDKMKVEFLEFPSGKVARLTSQPGWTWTECVSPIAGTETCQAHHLGVVTKGDLTIFGDDGSEETFGPGDAYEVLPGHTAQVKGDEEVECFEFASETAETYAK